MPTKPVSGSCAIEARKARQAAALRENLRRRKQQGRARGETPPPPQRATKPAPAESR